ncbi:amidohydrolase family protein [Sphingobium scionense]
MRAFVAYCAAEGVKSLKLVISGEDALKPGSSQDILYTDAEMIAAGEAAREAGLWIATHAYSPRAINLALEAGARILYHCSFADDAAVDAMAAKKDAIFYAPGPGVSVAALEASPPPHIDMRSMKASGRAAGTGKDIGAQIEGARRARPAGRRLWLPFNPHGRNARDLEHFVTYYGFTPAEALHAATMLGGELMDQPLGQVKPGYLADLLLVEGDPTTDVRLLQDAANIKMIMLGGRMHKSPCPSP